MPPDRISARVQVAVQSAVVHALYQLPLPVRRALAGRPVRIDGQTFDTDMQLLQRLAKARGVTLRAPTPAMARDTMAAGVPVTAIRHPEPVATRDLRIPTEQAELRARLYTPATPDGEPTGLLVYYHGGGWVIGDLATHDDLCGYLANHARTRVLAVDYRLAPEHPFPAAVDDALAAFSYARERAEELGTEPHLVAVGGDSAGGNLAAVVCQQAAEAGRPRPAFALLIYPAADATVRRPSRELFGTDFLLTSEDMDWFLDHYQPDVAARADPRLSVLLASDLSGFPPTYVAVAGFDPLRDEDDALVVKLAEAGVPVASRRYASLQHGFANLLGISAAAREAVAEAAGALHLGLTLAARNGKP